MNDTKHTPGPWVAYVYLGGAYGIHHVSPNGYSLGRVAIIDGLIECKANALLIAAAPEMLEALEEIMNQTDGRNNSVMGQDRAYSIARAAIAKAKGEQP